MPLILILKASLLKLWISNFMILHVCKAKEPCVLSLDPTYYVSVICIRLWAPWCGHYGAAWSNEPRNFLRQCAFTPYSEGPWHLTILPHFWSWTILNHFQPQMVFIQILSFSTLFTLFFFMGKDRAFNLEILF